MSSGIYLRTEECKRSLSLAKRGKAVPWFTMLGKHHSDEAKKKIAKFQMGSKRSEKTRMKMSLSKIGKKYFLGKKHSDEAKRKIALSHMGNKNNLGRKHSKETLNKMSVVMREIMTWKYLSGEIVGNRWNEEVNKRVSLSKAIRLQKIKGKFGPYKGMMFRSAWELLVAKKMDEFGINWQYEPEYFVLKDGRTYTPDFKTDFGWLEVKGFLFKSSVEKMNMFVEEGNDLFVVDGRNINNPELYSSIRWGEF